MDNILNHSNVLCIIPIGKLLKHKKKEKYYE